MNNQQLFNIIKSNNFNHLSLPHKRITITNNNELTENNDCIKEYNLIKQQNSETLAQSKENKL